MAGGGSIRRGLAGITAAASCATAQAQPAPTFPSATDRAALVAWLRQETDITPAQVVAVSNAAVTAVVGIINTQDPKGVRMSLRAEAIDPRVSGREGVLSWHMVVEADCAGRKLRMGATTGYAGRNLLGEGREIRPGADGWSEPKAGSQLESVWRSACEPSFQRPLTTTRIAAAAAAATPAAARSSQPPKPQPQLRAMIAQTPPPRPAAQPAPKTSPPPAPVAAPRPASPPPASRSTAMVQIGALASRGMADAALAGLRARFAGAMNGLSTTVIPATVGGRTVYRAMVTGFARAADANQFCSSMKANGVACFVRN